MNDDWGIFCFLLHFVVSDPLSNLFTLLYRFLKYTYIFIKTSDIFFKDNIFIRNLLSYLLSLNLNSGSTTQDTKKIH